MAQAMTSYRMRALRNFLIMLILAEFVVIHQESAPLLGDRHFTSGWLLVIVYAALLLFNVRKKLAMLPILSAATWLQAHIYIGLFASVVFLLHTEFRYPQGVLNIALWWGFVALFLSGIFGIAAERGFAPRLRRAGEAILRNRIPIYRLQLAVEAEGLAARSIAETSSPLIADLYRERIAQFMGGARNFWPHLVGNTKPIERLTGELKATERYLNPQAQKTLAALTERVVAKNNLDHQRALMSVLRGWLFIHIPLAYGLLVLIGVHVLVAYAFARI
jgi:hypothetical protein